MDNIEDIKRAVDNGKNVYHRSRIYQVKPSGNGGYDIVCLNNGYRVGLTQSNGKINGDLSDFFIKDDS